MTLHTVLPRLHREFGKEVKFTVAKKADSLYKTVSAASIVAKVGCYCCCWSCGVFLVSIMFRSHGDATSSNAYQRITVCKKDHTAVVFTFHFHLCACGSL